MGIGILGGIVLVLIGGVLNGSFALPMKKLPAWRWENTWLVYAIFGTLVVPWLLALLSVPHLMGVYHQAGWRTLILVALFGLGWGIGSTLFGLGIDRVGMALGFTVILGITAGLGSLLPLAILHPGQLLTRQGYALAAGLLLIVLGIVFSSIAGRRREQEHSSESHQKASSSFRLGLVICVFSGILSAMLNFSFVFGGELQRLSLAAGASSKMAANAIWALALTAGFLPNAAYCFYLLRKNKTWSTFLAPDAAVKYWLGAVVMGVVWFGGIAFYGFGAVVLGALGGIVGWPLFLSANIMTANVLGAATGEWKDSTSRTYAYSWIGIAILIAAIFVISRGAS
ncbi:MAG: L-rhamnose/proton symporter RhaT [Terriglobia bacterium]